MKKSYLIKLTEGEMDLLSMMLEQESGKARICCKHATSPMDDYGYKEELKSLWKKVYTNGLSFPYKFMPKYEIE